MFKLSLFFIILVYINTLIQFSNAQVTFTNISQPIVTTDPQYRGCLVQVSLLVSYIFGILYETEIFINPSEYFSLPTDPNIKPVQMIDQSDFSKQTFILSSMVIPGDYTMKVEFINSTRSMNTQLNIFNITCLEFDKSYMNILQINQTPAKSTSLFSYLNVVFNFTKPINSDILCNVDGPFICQCEKSFPFKFGSFNCTIKLVAQYSIMIGDTLKVTFKPLNFPEFTSEARIRNPFPQKLRTSIIRELNFYPPSTYNFSEDGRLQGVTKSFSIIQDVVIENMNSLLCNTNFSDPLVVSKNSTHTRYINSYPLLDTYRGKLNSYLLDSTSTSIFNYTSTLYTNNVIFENASIGINDPKGIVKYLTYTIVPNFVFQYQLSLTAYNSNYGVKFMSPYYLNSSKSSTPLYRITIPINSQYNGDITAQFTGIQHKFVDQLVSDDKTPTKFTLNSVTLIPLTPNTNIITITITSNHDIESMMISGTKITVCDLISVSMITSVYQAVIPSSPNPFSLSVLSTRGDSITYYSGQVYNNKFDIFPKPIYDSSKFLFASDLTFVKFDYTNIDLSNGDIFNNTLYLNFSKYIPEVIPCFTIIRKQCGYYNTNIQLYVINFQIKPWAINFRGSKIVDLNGLMEEIPYESIPKLNTDPIVGESQSMTIVNPINAAPPLVNYLKSGVNSTHIMWDIGFDSKFSMCYARVVSQIDTTPYIIPFVGDNNSIDFIYTVAINLTQSFCKQIYTLDTITCGSQSLEADYSLTSVLGTIYQKELSLSPLCTGPKDTDPPVLVNIVAPLLVDVGGNNTEFEITFTTKDVGFAGISLRHNPTVYLSSGNGDQYQSKSSLVSIDSDKYTYKATILLPYGFGYREIYISIYDICDNHFNYQSYTMLDLKNMSLPYYIPQIFNFSVPLIQSSSPILQTGGSLYIYGKAMGLSNSDVKAMIDYQDGQGFIPIPILFRSAVAIQLNIKPVADLFKIQLKVDGVKSNQLFIFPILLYQIAKQPTPIPTTTPTPSSTPSPSLCPGTPPCNNRGTCNPNSGCQCQSPWYGPSCLSEIIPIEKPMPQPEPITGTNITNNNNINNNVTSMIKVLEIREIDSNDNIIQRYSIGNWNFTDLTSISANPTYQYTSILNQTSTSIKTTINFFENKTDINFGNEILTMQPSSIKFTIELSKYEFQSQTNFLQIIMESIIKGNNRNSCSSEQFGSDNNNKNDIKWMKIDIDKTSLYGRFIDFGMIDDRVTRVNNRIISDSGNKQSNTERSMKVGITIPKYDVSAIIDPDFSNLITTNDENSDQLCKSSNKKLSTGAIIGIVVGCVGLVLIVTSIIVIHKKYKYKIKMMIEMQERTDTT